LYNPKNRYFASFFFNTGMLLKQDQAKIDQIFSQYIKLHPEVSLIYVGTTEGKLLLTPSQKLPDDFDARQRPWYQDAMNHKGEVVITKPYIDAVSRKMMITVAKITDDGSGVVGIDLSIDEIAKITHEIKIGKEGYVFVVDSAGKYLVQPPKRLARKLQENGPNIFLTINKAGLHIQIMVIKRRSNLRRIN
jgi:methyl-accepting chemotaxis protein